MRILEIGFGFSGVNIEKGYYPRGVTVVGLDPLLATYPPVVAPRVPEYSTDSSTATAAVAATATATATSTTATATTATTTTATPGPTTTATATTTTAERVYQQQATLALDNHGVLLAGDLPSWQIIYISTHTYTSLTCRTPLACC